eukprot:3689235-Ditylum_brightwellii.AAC.1
MSVSEEEVVLKESTISTFNEDVSELMITCAWGVTVFVEVKKSESLDDVRTWIDQELDDNIIMKFFLFQINAVVVSRTEEINTPVWQSCGQQIVSIIADDIDTSSTSDIKPILITEN